MTTQMPDATVPADASASQTNGSKSADELNTLLPTAPLVRVAWPGGLTDTLHAVDHELQLLSHATKYKWINERLILLRNALIAISVLVIVVVAAVACYREAYRETLTVAAFDVPDSLAKRGITGQVVAKALFDELIKRRDLVTTLETGELKGAWAENRADVAIPEAKFTLQAVFRYLRYMTGNEIAIDGEFIVDGEDVTMKVRVAGKPPKVVKGKLADWESMVGELALGVLEVTQPAVLAAYMGIKAKTPEDIGALSKHIVKMQNAAQKPSAAVMSVAYDAYGSALLRQSRQEEARAAFAEAMTLDPTNGVAVINAADAQSALRNYAEASVLYVKAQSLRLPDTVKVTALVRRVAGATAAGDCPVAAQALQDAKASPSYAASFVAGAEALYIVRCEFEEARGAALIERYATLHPDAVGPANWLGIVQLTRPEKRHLDDAINVFRRAVKNGVEDPSLYNNLAAALAARGEYEESRQIYEKSNQLRLKIGAPIFSDDGYNGTVYFWKGEFAKADAALRRFYTTTPLREERQFVTFAGTQTELLRFDEATTLYNDALQRFPKSCLLWEGFGNMYAKKGDVAMALATFDKGIAVVPRCGSNYNAAARFLIKQNRVPEAKQKLDALIKIAPNSDGAVIAEEILATL
jgi:tetratricopeptide (TPR) repeat protein